MYCKYCGEEINEKAVICPKCGQIINAEALGRTTSSTSNQTNVLALVGFILSFFVSIAGLVCSIIGYKKAPEYGGNGKNLALAGIIISAISIALSIIYVIAIFGIYGTLLCSIINDPYYNDVYYTALTALTVI